jgi:predicted dehydrogenase
MSDKPVTAVIVGAGHRSLHYASYSIAHPDELKIVGVADPVARRREQVAAKYQIPRQHWFESAEELANQPKMADAVINGTMDHHHVPTSLPLLRAGYDLLLEKPLATSETEMRELARTTADTGRTVLICHVLRYAPFYRTVRELIMNGAIGDVINIQTTEHVSYHHMAVGFVRGKWNNKDKCRSSMLMSKCCHDLDLLAWMKSGISPSSVASFGSNMYFRPENMPEGAGYRCLVDCEIESNCLYSARKHYLDHPDRWSFYVWDTLEHIERPSLAQKEASLKADNPYGRCVWRCDNDVVDHQSVAVAFADGSTATHNMVGGTARPSRSIHLLGTKGEIQGVFEDSRIIVRHIDTAPGCEYTEEIIDLNETGDMHGATGGHGGGDLRLVSDFVNTLRGLPRSISCTSLDDSLAGHSIGFSADRAMEEHAVVNLEHS